MAPLSDLLSESEHHLGTVLRGAHAGVWVMDLIENTAAWSPELRELIGVEPDEPSSTEKFMSLIHPEDRPGAEAYTQTAIQQGGPFYQEFRLVRPDGRIIWLSSIGFVEYGPDGRPVTITGINQDITDRKLSEIFSLALDDINQIIHSSLDFDTILRQIVSSAAKTFGSDTAVLSLRKGNHWVTSAVYGFPGDILGSVMNDDEERHAILAIQTGKPVAVNDCLHDERVNREHLKKWGVRAVLVVPVLVREEAIGVIFLNYHHAPFEFRPVHLDFAVKLAAALSLALENARLFEHLKQEIAERERAEEMLEAALYDIFLERNRLQAVMDALPVGVAILDAQGGVMQTNAMFDQVWGGTPPAAQAVQDYIVYNAWWVDSGRPVLPEEWAAARAVQKGEIVVGQFLQIQRFDGSRAFVQNSSVPIRDADGNIVACVVGIMDITEQMKAKEALRESQERFRVAMTSVPMYLYTCDRDLRYTWVYRLKEGLTLEGVIGKRDDEIFAPEEMAELVAAKQWAVETGQAGVRTIKTAPGGKESYYLLTMEPVKNQNGAVVGLTCAAIDITDQKRLEIEQEERALQIEIHRRLMENREQERQEIAREIHDGPIQTLVSTIFNIQFTKEALQDRQLQVEFDQIGLSLKTAVRELREVVNELRPPSLIRFGLTKAIKIHAEDFREKHPELDLQLEIDDDHAGLPESTCLALFRVYQEALNNVIRHAEATTATIRFKLSSEQAMLEIQDNGRGFLMVPDLAGQTEEGHFGMAGMKERAEAAGGTFLVRSHLGQGATIQVRVPLKKL